MIKDYVDAWNENKDKLEKYFKKTKQEKYETYRDIVEQLIKIVINPYIVKKYGEFSDKRLDVDNMKYIDDGDYQGTSIYIIPEQTYQPDVDNYVYTNNYYGSCSGCDTLLAISCYQSGIPAPKQVEGYMTIALHLLQKFKRLEDENILVTGETIEK